MSWTIRAMIASAALAALACDPSGVTRDAKETPKTPDRRSAEHETCSSSADCAADLRCLDAVCRRSKVSLIGDLHAAVGDRAVAAGRAKEAAEAYGQALAQYDREKIDPPAHLLCAQGSALADEAGAAREQLERAARLLHRCLNGAPPGSFLRQLALGDLAGLMERGLDPELLTRREPADLYLTRKPSEPAAAAAAPSIQVLVALESRSRSRSFRKFSELMQKSADLKAAFTPCWKAYVDATSRDSLTATVPFQYGSAWDEDETYLSSWIKVEPEAAPQADPPLAAAGACLRQAVTPLVEAEGKKLREETRWQAVATFTIAPEKP